MLETSAPEFLCFSHLRWNFVFQRPQHLLTRASESYRVHYIEEPRFIEKGEERIEVDVVTDRMRVVTPLLPASADPAKHTSILRALIDGYVAYLDSAPRVGWYYTPMALPFTDHLEFPVTVYDCMDELANFKGAPPGITTLERRLFGRADLVFTGGRSLYESKRRHHDSVHAFPSSIDAAHFRPARARTLPDPRDVEHLDRPRIGWFGVIDERLDLELVDAVAAARPGWQFVMIGPIVKIDESSLPRRPNIHWLGGKDYKHLPQYLAAIDIGWMPFAINDSTRFISPTKTPEFLAAGLPVVSTPIKDVVRSYGALQLVEIAATPTESITSITRLLENGRRTDWMQRVDRVLASDSWDRTWSAMRTLIEQAALRRSLARTQPKLSSEVARV